MRLAILFLAATALLTGCGKPKADAPQAAASGSASLDTEAAPTGRLDRSHAGTPAPSAEFKDPDGEPVTLAQFAGKPLLVNLWATWCGPCVAEMPTLDALAGRNGPVRVLAISQDSGGKDKVDAFFAQHGFKTLEPYLDADMELMTEIKIDTLPTTILYDAQGREVWRMTGMEDWRAARAAGLLKEAGAAS